MIRRWICLLVLLSGPLGLTALAQAGVTEVPAQAQIAPSQLTPSVASAPPVDPLFENDVGVWAYTPEFAERFKRQKLKEPAPTGAHAVNFQVHRVEELDRCVFKLFLDNTLPIDYPDGPVGFLPFTYPSSWAFLTLSPEDQRAVETAYLAKYQEPRATLVHAAGGVPLTMLYYRKNLYADMAEMALTVDCNQLSAAKGVLRIRLKTTGASPHEITVAEHFPHWIDATLKKWRRPDAKLQSDGLADRNVWSYTPEFAARFGLPPPTEPPPTGAQAVAWRVEQSYGGYQKCFLDVYLDEAIPIVLPEGEHGFSGFRGGPENFLGLKDRSKSVGWFAPYDVTRRTNFFVLREVPEKEQSKLPHYYERIKGNLFRVTEMRGFMIDQYRKQGFPEITYLSYYIGCLQLPTVVVGTVGVWITKIDGQKQDVIMPAPFLERVFQDWRVRVEIPLKCKSPKFYREEKCPNS